MIGRIGRALQGMFRPKPRDIDRRLVKIHDVVEIVGDHGQVEMVGQTGAVIEIWAVDALEIEVKDASGAKIWQDMLHPASVRVKYSTIDTKQ